MHLFPKAMLEAYKARGEVCRGSILHPIHSYGWKYFIDGVLQWDEQFSIWEYLCDHPYAPGVVAVPPAKPPENWGAFDMVVFETLEQCDRDMLYLGAGSGRYSRAVGALGLQCTNVDIAPECIELMALRGIDAIEGDCCDLGAFGDNSFPLVVIPPWPFDGCAISGHGPEELIAGAARVAAERVVVSGFQIGADLEPVPYSEEMSWQGETDSRPGFSYHHQHVIQMFEAAGMVPDEVRIFSGNLEEPSQVSWVIQAKFPE